MSEQKFTPQEITDSLEKWFGATLIISAAGWIFYGSNLYHFVNFLLISSKGDRASTKIWLTLVWILTTAALIYQVYYDWCYSILVFTQSAKHLSMINGNVVALYSSVILLVQLFWLGCIKRMMSSKPKLSWFIVVPIGFVSLASFGLGVAVGALSNRVANGEGFWPSETISVIHRVMLGLDAGVDIVILLVVLIQLLEMKKSSSDIKQTFSKSSHLLLVITALSAIFMITEFVIRFPGLGLNGVVHPNITFAPIITNLYAFGILAVLNVREQSAPTELEGKGFMPAVKFSVDVHPEKESKIDPDFMHSASPTLVFDHSPKEQQVDA